MPLLHLGGVIICGHYLTSRIFILYEQLVLCDVQGLF